jgi:heme A synthase
MRILSWWANLLAVLSLVYLMEWTRWHRLRRFPDVLRSALLAPVFMFVMVATEGIARWLYSFPLGTALGHAALLQLSHVLPNNLLVVTAVGTVPVMGMYWLIEQQFRMSELRGPVRQPSAWDRIMRQE